MFKSFKKELFTADGIIDSDFCFVVAVSLEG